jgi:regulator of protease activity HflC (stomatin/prohibitin superfamily)
MSKKVIIIVSAIIAVVIVVGVVFFVIQQNALNTGGSGTTAGGLPPVSVPTGATGVQTPPVVIPTSTAITLGTNQGSVVVNNFYQSPGATVTQDQQAVIIENSGDYAITYNVPDSSFSIALLSLPLEAARQAAESAFLSALGISKQDACKLTVYEGVPIGVSDQYPGESFPLSFCGGPPTL